MPHEVSPEHQDLVIQLARLGDLVQTLPAIEALQEAYPERTLDVVCAAPLIAVLTGARHIRRVIPWNGAQWQAWANRWQDNPTDTLHAMQTYIASFGDTTYERVYPLNQHARSSLITQLFSSRTSRETAQELIEARIRPWAQYLRHVAKERGANRVHLADAWCGMCGVRPRGQAPLHVPPSNLHTYGTPTTNRGMYEAMCQALDTEVGRVLATVNLTNTHVIFIGDNGTAGNVIARPYSPTKAKASMYEGGVRVPLIVAGAGVVSPNRRVTALVSAVDLFPTILQLAGIDPQTALPVGTVIDGVSLLPLLRRRGIKASADGRQGNLPRLGRRHGRPRREQHQPSGVSVNAVHGGQGVDAQFALEPYQ